MDNMKKLFFLPILFLALFSSCKKDPVLPDNTLTPAMARDSLYDIMKDVYFWYNMPEASSVTTANKDNYKDPYELLEAMRYRELDRWSFVADYDEFNAEMQGEFVGHGFRIGVDQSGKARVAMIYKNSNLYTNGVRRGWIIKTINGVDPAPILIAGDGAAYTKLIGASTAGITNIFVFTKPDGTDVTIPTTKSTFNVNTVLLYDTLHLKSGVTGHLVFESFYNPAPQELITAFSFFQAKTQSCLSNLQVYYCSINTRSAVYLRCGWAMSDNACPRMVSSCREVMQEPYQPNKISNLRAFSGRCPRAM